MGGTILNVATVLVGSLAGLAVGNRLPPRLRMAVVAGLGIVTLYIGFDNARATGNIIIPLLAIVIGVLIGEALHLDRRLERVGEWLQSRFGRGKIEDIDGEDDSKVQDARSRFVTGFVTASLVFCIGPLTFLGAIYDGMGLPLGFRMLAIKSTLDGFASMAFAASFGIGVIFSAVSVFVIQGGLALVGVLVGEIMSEAMLDETTAVGGLILIGLSFLLMDIKDLRIANFLPALVIAPLLVALAEALGLNIYPQI
ncbi:MAG: DUF554 family protein [Acidimicrobiia bacterium]|nr:DUF554 family protein [Acidimicrobiia bacterium]